MTRRFLAVWLPASVALAASVACEPEFLPPPPAPASAPAGAAPVSSSSSSAAPTPSPSPSPAAAHHAASELDPSLATAQAPEVFLADFTTTKGDFVVEVHRAWAPHAADRFFNLIKLGFYDDTRFFRAIPDFMVQFGISGEPEVAAKWRGATIADDPVTQSNLRGFMTFAQTGRPDSRTTQVFILYSNHPTLDASRFAPFAKVVRGMEVVDDLYKGYGEGAPKGSGPDQNRIQDEGNGYLDRDFPRLDRVLRTRIVER
ncbi:MAG: peptidylprolyl isomerase [Polyangiaceae bacterium]